MGREFIQAASKYAEPLLATKHNEEAKLIRCGLPLNGPRGDVAILCETLDRASLINVVETALALEILLLRADMPLADSSEIEDLLCAQKGPADRAIALLERCHLAETSKGRVLASDIRWLTRTESDTEIIRRSWQTPIDAGAHARVRDMLGESTAKHLLDTPMALEVLHFLARKTETKLKHPFRVGCTISGLL
jgi:hypothetical protein